MKKYCLMTIMALVLAFQSAQAAIYIVGSGPFGNWDPAHGIEMTDEGNGTYTLTTSINETVWFVFADKLTSDWTDFNANHRYGPNGNSSQDVQLYQTYTTQKANNNHAYKFTGNGDEYTFTFNLNDLTFKVESHVEPLDNGKLPGGVTESVLYTT